VFSHANPPKMQWAWRGNCCNWGTPCEHSKQGSETQRPHGFSHTHNIDKADKHITKTQMMVCHLLQETRF
jgi:hypothetical protein